jgi:hypothetical protein
MWLAAVIVALAAPASPRRGREDRLKPGLQPGAGVGVPASEVVSLAEGAVSAMKPLSAKLLVALALVGTATFGVVFILGPAGEKPANQPADEAVAPRVSFPVSATGAEPPVGPDPKSVEETKKDEQARQMAEEWVRLMLAKYLRGLLKIADVPHYEKGGAQIHVSRTKKELEMSFGDLHRKDNPRDLSVKITRVRSYGEGPKLLWSARRPPEVVLEDHYVEGKKVVRPRMPQKWDDVLRTDDRLVWVEAAGSDPGGSLARTPSSSSSGGRMES